METSAQHWQFSAVHNTLVGCGRYCPQETGSSPRQALRAELLLPEKRSTKETHVGLSPLEIQKLEIQVLKLRIKTVPKFEPRDLGHEPCYHNREFART